jgi:N-acetylmuramoyl-L-alanine amidase/putative methionine-R-sulfoxide reductase with GAF domain
MATHPSNANPGLTIKAIDASEAAHPKAVSSVAVSTDRREALQALLAFSTLHEQIRRRRTEEARRYAAGLSVGEDAWEFEQFVLDEVLQLVAERAQTITGADGIAIALAEGDEIICRASAGTMAPDRGVRLDAQAGFSGACFRTGRIVRCDDSERDPRVNVEACRRLGTRSMVAVPLLGQESVVGLLEAFSTEPFGFSDSDVRSLNLLAELILAALKPEDEDRIVRAAKVAAAELRSAELESLRQIPMSPPPLPVLPRVAEPEPQSVPLEFSKGDIAPALYQGGGEGWRPGLLVGLVAAVLVLLAGGIWWKVHNASRASVFAAAKNSASTTGRPRVAATAGRLSPSAGAGVQPAAASPALKVSGLPVVSGIRHWSAAGTSTVAIDLQDQVQYEAHRLSGPDRIYFDLLDTTLAPELNGKIIDVGDGLIGRVRIAQPADNVTRVVLDAKSGSTFSVRLEQNPCRLVIEVRGVEAGKPQPNGKIAVPAPSAQSGTSQRVTLPEAPPTSADVQLRAHAPRLRIVLDAGHGGWDLGTVGHEGLLEKNLVLEVAQRLGNLLESRLGSEVIFTRKDDSYIALEQRAQLANRVQADLFVSVHANYSSLASARGVETYYSSFFSPPEAREIEYRENENALAVTHAKLTGSELKDKVKESRKLAASVQRELYGTLASQNVGIRDRGVKEASFVVLTGTEMPSILAEISFVSSPADEQRLQSAEYRQRIADALYKGIERFAATTARRVKMASTAGRSTGQ